MKYLLGIDFGGGASKATLLNTQGEIVAENTVEYPTLHPQDGWCEQCPEHWISALNENIKALLLKSGANSEDILAVAVDSATHTAVICDENATPLRDAIHWTDTRSTSEAKYLAENFGELIFQKAYHKPDTIWTLPQLMWVKKNEPEIFEKIKYIFFEKDYIRYFLTGVYCTDYIEAQGSMLFDYNEMCWSKELCDLGGIDIALLPKLVNPTDIVGGITKAASESTGLKEGTPVIAGSTDTVMEVFASGAVKKGDITVKLATAGRICVITDKPYPHKYLINYSHIAKGLWYPGTATKSCAASYRWYRDTFGGDYKELDKGASEVEIGSNRLMFHPYLNGELTPYGDPKLCGSFTGMRAGHTKAHFTRAVMEGVSLSLLDCKRALDEIGIKYGDKATVIGGGAKGEIWRQITADVLGISLTTTRSSDSSLGSAMLAGVAIGVFESPEQAASLCVKQETTTYPNLENTKKYEKIFARYKKIHDALAHIYSEMD